MKAIKRSNSTNMSFRVNKDLKNEADELFKKLGLNTSAAINIFLAQCVREQAIPFNISMVPFNEKLDEAIKEIDMIKSGKIKAKEYDSFEDVLKDI